MSEEIKFETALKRLEEIVTIIEKGDLELEKSIELFEEGIRMSKSCRGKLGEAEKKIEQLIRGRDGELTTTPMESPPDDDVPF